MSAVTDKQALIVQAKRIAGNFKLDPCLVCGVIEQESNWNTWAMRYEPMFMARYVAPLYTNNKITASEAYARSFSWGLMQVMGQVAREVGFDMQFLSALCDAEAGISIGCAVLARKLDANKGDVTQGLQAWNGGGNPAYAGQVLARMSRYQ